ncbi:F-box/FBD/LRR-repeat protein At1g13570 [Lactuca sativa]|uniref:F-box/FBD/LRR-repeat protein At1g13570 n=1 Tax=Lactuca sativa TaxID=4236 RepID=UPI001C6900A7|nr:F-box/FBD/LRR-repeat protein At1g13570 [Lactuca sativa]
MNVLTLPYVSLQEKLALPATPLAVTPGNSDGMFLLGEAINATRNLRIHQKDLFLLHILGFRDIVWSCFLPDLTTENHRVEVVTCAKEDIISSLPEHLIDLILERVPLEEAVRTSILSKKWRYRWTKMGALVFDEQFFNKYSKNGAFGRNGFIMIIYKVLILHKGHISKFLLDIPNINMFLDSFEEVDQWMLLLSRNGVKELILTNSSQCYKLPSYVFSCLELRKLELENCFFKPPDEFEGFVYLNDLELCNVDFGANLCGTEINLPQLKELSLFRCTNVYNFKIKATKLKNLIVFESPDSMVLHLLHNPCLMKVFMSFLKPIDEFVRDERKTLSIVLSNLPKIKSLYLDGLFFKVLIAEKLPKLLPCAISSLKHLCLLYYELSDLDQLHGALCLLRNSPNLESLSVRFVENEPQAIRYDVGPASDHLEAANCLDCTLEQLQTVEITYVEGSKPELLFIKLLLAHCPSLQKFTITTSGDLDAKKILDISKDVMRFPRASPKAEVVYLNSET